MIYFAGYGAVEDDTVYLVPSDADVERVGETAIPLDEIARLPDGIGQARVTLILDTPFVRRFEGRSSPDEIPLSLAETLDPILVGTDEQVLTAAEIGDACVELGEIGHGLFTYYLLRGMQGVGDDNRDGQITWHEAYAFAHRMVTQHAQVEGQIQRPGFFSTTAAGGAATAELP